MNETADGPAVSFFQTRDGGLGGWVCPLIRSPPFEDAGALMLWLKQRSSSTASQQKTIEVILSRFFEAVLNLYNGRFWPKIEEFWRDLVT